MKRASAWVMLLVCLAACATPSRVESQPEPLYLTQTAPSSQLEVSPTSLPLLPTGTQAPGEFQETACRFPLPDGLEQGKDITCGFLTVAEQRALSNTRLIQLHVAILHRPDGPLHADPVFFLAGGPGYSPLEGLHAQYEALTKTAFAAGRDLVVFDQRGVGLSRPTLDCPAYDQWTIELLDREVDGHPVTPADAYQLIEDSIVACSKALRQTADLSAYNSAASAEDVYELQLALGYESINLWGGSYGSRLALEVMRRHPEGLRSVVIEAVYPPSVDLFVEGPANFNRSLEKMFAGCAQNTSCQMHFPDLEDVFFETVDRLNTAPEKRTLKDLMTGEEIPAYLDGNALLGTVFNLLYDSTWRYAIPKHIYAANRGDYADFDLVRSALISRMGYSSRGMMFSVLCNEEIPFSAVEDFHRELQHYSDIVGVYEQSILGEVAYRICPQWGAGQSDASANLPVTSAVDTLIMSGEYDPITPPSWGEIAAKTLENAYLYEFPGLGHGVSGKSGCPQQMMEAFWSNPTQKPDSACLNAMP